MANPTLDDTCCRVDILEKALNKEAMICHSMEDPVEAALIDYYVTCSQTEEKEEYATLLNVSTTHAHRQPPRRSLTAEEHASKEKERSATKVELKPLPLYLRYEFPDPDHKFPLIVNTKLNKPQLEK